MDVDYETLPPVIDMTTAADSGAPVLFPAAGTNVAATMGDASALAADLFAGCEVVVSRTIIEPAGRARADGDAGPPRRPGARTAG